MAQQTQVSRVVTFYTSWLKKFPTFRALANASKADVLHAWSGLGYNNRALRLHALSKIVSGNPPLPRSVEELAELPGIGKYTAHAIACFAFNAHVGLVDINIRRVYSRVFWRVRSGSELKQERMVWEIAEKYMPARNAGEWNQAIMELGALVCTARNPKCGECPISAHCASAFSKALAENGAVRKAKEPSFKGIPRRIYRGKILKALHHKPMTSLEIAQKVVGRFHRRDLPWIDGVLAAMERDELVTIRGTGERKQIQIAQ